MKKTGLLLTVILLFAMLCGCALPPGAVRYRAAKKYEFELDEQSNIIYGTIFRKPVTINSRQMTTAATHAASSWNSTSISMIVVTNILSASGSIKAPKSVT